MGEQLHEFLLRLKMLFRKRCMNREMTAGCLRLVL
jgi:hypothetical protein